MMRYWLVIGRWNHQSWENREEDRQKDEDRNQNQNHKNDLLHLIELIHIADMGSATRNHFLIMLRSQWRDMKRVRRSESVHFKKRSNLDTRKVDSKFHLSQSTKSTIRTQLSWVFGETHANQIFRLNITIQAAWNYRFWGRSLPALEYVSSYLVHRQSLNSVNLNSLVKEDYWTHWLPLWSSTYTVRVLLHLYPASLRRVQFRFSNSQAIAHLI